MCKFEPLRTSACDFPSYPRNSLLPGYAKPALKFIRIQHPNREHASSPSRSQTLLVTSRNAWTQCSATTSSPRFPNGIHAELCSYPSCRH